MIARLRCSFSLLSFGAVLLLGGCADDVAITVTEGSSGMTQGTTADMETTGTPTTTTAPTSGGTTTTEGTSTGTGETSTSTGAVTVTDTDTTGPGTGTDTTDPGTSSSTTDPDTSGTGTTGDTDTGGDCVPGEVNCDCLNGECSGMAVCEFGKCLPFTGLCPFEINGFCDEPFDCEPGTDLFDCCASPQDGNCEEVGMGGSCPVFSDFYDCNECPFVNDFQCDEPNFCPPGSDKPDCCASEQDGICEEQSMGGMCQDGSDFFDCGYCPFEQDGFCDAPFFCPPDTDLVDCCATPENGACEEMQFGGICEDGSDFFDCGYCPFEQDGFCDAPFFCPPDTDLVDCCATAEDGICEEMQFGGICDNGTDFFDCGYCPFEQNGSCDAPFFCPPDTDLVDCCATPQDAVCEEMQFGGVCMDGSDHFDCGYCIDENDGICDEPGFCPEGTDDADCCVTNDDGICDELALGGACPEGVDFYDCGYCPFENDLECDVPFFCPEGSDVNDCS